MSKSIIIIGKYNNNKTNTVGLYNPQNIDMVDIEFNASELIDKACKYFTNNKCYKYFTIKINVSGSKSGQNIAINYKTDIISDQIINNAINLVNNLKFN